MKNERKCPSCGHWSTTAGSNCEKCHSLLDKNEILREEREKIHGKPKVEKPGWLDDYLERTKDTKNLFVKLARIFITVGWVSYMGLISFIIWLAVGFSG